MSTVEAVFAGIGVFVTLVLVFGPISTVLIMGRDRKGKA